MFTIEDLIERLRCLKMHKDALCLKFIFVFACRLYVHRHKTIKGKLGDTNRTESIYNKTIRIILYTLSWIL